MPREEFTSCRDELVQVRGHPHIVVFLREAETIAVDHSYKGLWPAIVVNKVPVMYVYIDVCIYVHGTDAYVSQCVCVCMSMSLLCVCI